MYLMYQNVLRDSGKSDDMRCFFVVFLGVGGGGNSSFWGHLAMRNVLSRHSTQQTKATGSLCGSKYHGNHLEMKTDKMCEVSELAFCHIFSSF